MNTQHLCRPFCLLAALVCLSVAAPRAHAASLLFWNFENATSIGHISTAVGAPGVAGITGFASQTGGGPDEDFGGTAGIVHLTRFFGTNYPYVQFTLTRRTLVQTVTFDHIHNHNYGFSTYPSYKAQLQLDTGAGFADVGDPLLLEGSNVYHTGASINVNRVLNAGTYQIRWLPRGLNYGYGFPYDTNTEYFALNNLSLNGVVEIDVAIDIMPGEYPNSINLTSNGVVPVAILSTPTFDATTVDPTTVTLAGAPVARRGNGTPQASVQDVNGDGRLDLVLQVNTSALQLSAGDTAAVLVGLTFANVPIRGADTVRIVP